MDIKTLQNMKFEDLIDIDVSKLNKDEIAIVEKRLMKVANQRISRLRKSGKMNLSKLTKTEKRGFKTTKSSKSGNLRNQMLHNTVKIQKFLQKKTTSTRKIDKQMERYKNVIRKTIGNSKMKISDRQAKRISRLMEKAKEMSINNDANKKMSGSPRLLQQIVDIVRSHKYIRNDEAERIIQTAINNGYEEAQKLLQQLNEEDRNSLDIESNENGFNPFS